MRITWQQRLTVGMLAYRSDYDKMWERPDNEAGYFNFTGQRNDMLSFSLAWMAPDLEASVEIARSGAGGAAGSAVVSGGTPKLRWTVESHYYARDFHSPHGRSANTFSDPPQNEFGYSLGISSRLRRGLIAEIFATKRQDLWRTSSLSLPGSRLVAGARIDWTIRRDVLLQLRWQETRDEASVSTEVIPSVAALGDLSQISEGVFVSRRIIVPQRRHSGRLKLAYQLSPTLLLGSRLDFAVEPQIEPDSFRGAAGDGNEVIIAQLHEPRDFGLALSQEWRWAVHRRLLIAGRYVFFDTPASAPIYQYEVDLPGMFTNFALRESGRRGYIYVHCLLGFGLESTFKLALTEHDASIFQNIQSWSWGMQIDWRLPIHLP
jgi:hypothetical protein